MCNSAACGKHIHRRKRGRQNWFRMKLLVYLQSFKKKRWESGEQGDYCEIGLSCVAPTILTTLKRLHLNSEGKYSNQRKKLHNPSRPKRKCSFFKVNYNQNISPKRLLWKGASISLRNACLCTEASSLHNDCLTSQARLYRIKESVKMICNNVWLILRKTLFFLLKTPCPYIFYDDLWISHALFKKTSKHPWFWHSFMV